jgi:hypothetical protein
VGLACCLRLLGARRGGEQLPPPWLHGPRREGEVCAPGMGYLLPIQHRTAAPHHCSLLHAGEPPPFRSRSAPRPAGCATSRSSKGARGGGRLPWPRRLAKRRLLQSSHSTCPACPAPALGCSNCLGCVMRFRVSSVGLSAAGWLLPAAGWLVTGAAQAFSGVLKMDPHSDKKPEILFRLGTIYKQACHAYTAACTASAPYASRHPPHHAQDAVSGPVHTQALRARTPHTPAARASRPAGRGPRGSAR